MINLGAVVATVTVTTFDTRSVQITHGALFDQRLVGQLIQIGRCDSIRVSLEAVGPGAAVGVSEKVRVVDVYIGRCGEFEHVMYAVVFDLPAHATYLGVETTRH